MRAKEYLEINKEKIKNYDIVKGAIDDLCLLRNDKGKTEEYFNKYLFSDARYAAQNGEFVRREGEVDVLCVQDVRINIMNAVCHDESFIFTFNVIIKQENEYLNLTPIKFCKTKDFNNNTVSIIENICCLYKDDYPKNNLMDYLLDDDNSIFYYEKHAELNKNEKWWLNVYNEAYTIFDNMRLKLHKPFEAKLLITQYECEDKDFENTVVDLVMSLVSHYNYDLNEKQKKAIALLSNIICQHFSKIKRQSYVDKINEMENVLKEKEEEYQRIIKIKDEAIESLKLELENKEEEIALLKKDSHFKGFSISQQNIFYYYIFNEMGINFMNSKKTDWAELISTIGGRNKANIRKALSLKFDDSATKKDMRIVAAATNDLLPNISQKILNDIGE